MHSTPALELVRLPPLMELTTGRPEIVIGLIDGPVALNHPELACSNVQEILGGLGACSRLDSEACQHGTFVAGILVAQRGSNAPAICPGCRLIVRPIFSEKDSKGPSATCGELALAISEVVEAGARLLNLSAALVAPTGKGQRDLQNVLDYAARKGVVVVAATGNEGTVGGSAITRHSAVIPVIAYDLQGRPAPQSNLGWSAGCHGLGAPGVGVTSIATKGHQNLGGTSAATPFVTGTLALLWSKFPTATAAEVRRAIVHAQARVRRTIVPPLLDAWAAYEAMVAMQAQA